MKTKYFLNFLIFPLTIILECSNFLKSAEAYPLNINSRYELISSKQNKDYIKVIDIKEKLNQSFYRNGYTYEESLKIKNQILDLFGVSFKNKRNILNFPEQRIESDAFLFWEAYKFLLEDQIDNNKKFTRDLDNGFNTSLYK